MKGVILTIILNLICFGVEASNGPLTLNDGQEYYSLGMFLDILKDPTGKLTIDDVNRSEWSKKFKRSKKKVPNFGQTTDVYWARFKIKNNSNRKDWILFLDYYLMDEIIFFRKNGKGWDKTVTGDTFKNSSKEVEGSDYIFRLNISEKEKQYFFRFKTLGTITMPLEIYSPEKFGIKTNKRFLVDGLYYGSIGIISIYNLFIYFSTFNPSYLTYVFYMVFMMLVTAGNTGFGLYTLYPNYPWLNNQGLCIFAFFGMLFLTLFASQFLKTKKKFPKLHKVVFLFHLVVSFLILIGLFVSNYYLNRITILIILVGMLLSLTIGLRSLFSGMRVAKFFVTAFSFYIIGAILKVLTFRGILPSHFIFDQGYILGHVVEAALLSLGLADVINVMKKEAILKNEKLNIAKNELADLNKNLEEKVNQRTQDLNLALKEVEDLLNNMRQAVFAIGKEGKIIAPVSTHAKEIFGDTIVGKNILEVLFGEEDRESEVYNKMAFMIDITIGEDSLFFDSIADACPSKVQINKNGKNKTLKTTFSAIINQNEIVSKILLIVEDITEVEALEKRVKEEEEKSAIKVKRLQEIVLNNKREIKTFCRETYLNLELAKKSVAKNNFEGFFRAVHTLKGTSRIFHLHSLSQGIHFIENKLVELKKDKGKNPQGLSDIYDSMKGLCDEYISLYKDVFGDDVDETTFAGEDDILEVSKKLFLSTVQNIQNLAEANNQTEILVESIKLIHDDLKNVLFGLQKIISSISKALKKEIQFNIKGDEVYLEFKISTMIKDSLTHIIQNSADHGIEKKGLILINIEKTETHIHIDVSDNGKGIDPLAIRKRAIHKGIVSAEDVENNSKKDDLNLIFLPGFSTKEIATEYSGRGVGLDVAKTNIEKLSGTLDIQSTLEKGTTFLIKIPAPKIFENKS